MNIGQKFSGEFFRPIKGIYKITNTATGRCYIGQSREVQSRLTAHSRNLGYGKHTISDMQGDWNEYGASTFDFEIIEHANSKDQRLLREAEIIAEIIEGGGEVYNLAIHSPKSIKNQIKARKQRLERQEKQAAAKQAALSLKTQSRINEDGQTEAGCDKGGQTLARRKNHIFRNRPVPRPEPVAPLAGDKQKLRVEEVDLCIGTERFDRAAGTERPPSESVDENGRFKEGYEDIQKVLPKREYYIDNELGDYLGCAGVEDEQWQEDIEDFTYCLEDNGVDSEEGQSFLAWFLRTYIGHDVLRKTVEELDSPMLYINFDKGPEHLAKILKKHMPDWELLLKELEKAN